MSQEAKVFLKLIYGSYVRNSILSGPFQEINLSSDEDFKN